MSTALTAEGRDLLSRHLLGDSATSFPAGCWLTLHSAQPGNAGASQINALRTAVSLSYDATNKWFTNSSPISVASVTGTVNWVALWHGAGTGNVWFEGQVSSPITVSGASVLIAANSLKIYATAPDGSNKGGIAEKGAELGIGHFLGVSSWSMPTSFALRTHSASAGVTGNANLSATLASLAKSFTYDTGNFFYGTPYYSPGYSGNSRYWSTTDASGNALIYGEAASGEQAWADYFADSKALNRVDFSGAADSTDSLPGHTVTYNSMRVSFDVASVVNGDVASGTLVVNTVASPSVTLSLRSSTAICAATCIALISVGSTSVARGIVYCTANAQIGDSAPGIGFAGETLLFDSLVSLQIL